MANVNVTHEFNLGQIYIMQRNPAGGVARDMYRRGQKVRTAAMQYVGYDTGRLKTSLHVEQFPGRGTIITRIGSNVEYAREHHDGHPAIRPKFARYLIFQIGGRWVYTKLVHPQPGTRYLTRALPAARD